MLYSGDGDIDPDCIIQSAAKVLESTRLQHLLFFWEDRAIVLASVLFVFHFLFNDC